MDALLRRMLVGAAQIGGFQSKTSEGAKICTYFSDCLPKINTFSYRYEIYEGTSI